MNFEKAIDICEIGYI